MVVSPERDVTASRKSERWAVEPFDLNSREAYYAAGILTWMGLHGRDSFSIEDLREWLTNESYDFSSDQYLGDGVLASAAADIGCAGSIVQVS